jgi:hypothetical protein
MVYNNFAFISLVKWKGSCKDCLEFGIQLGPAEIYQDFIKSLHKTTVCMAFCPYFCVS